MCPPGSLGQRVACDLAYVRSYLLKDGKLYLSLMADGAICEWGPQQAAAVDTDRSVKPVRFAKGKTATVIKDCVVGRHSIDYTLRAGAGQRMTVSLKGSNHANYFDLLPPGSADAATVELRWDTTRKRRILFVKGEPKATDVPEAMTFKRNERGWKVTFNGDEHFEIPEPLVYGG